MKDCIIIKDQKVNERFHTIAKGVYKNVLFYAGYTLHPDIDFKTGQTSVKICPVCYIELTPMGIMKGIKTPEEVSYVGPSHFSKDTMVCGWDYFHCHNKKYALEIESIDEFIDDSANFIRDIYEAIDSFAL